MGPAAARFRPVGWAHRGHMRAEFIAAQVLTKGCRQHPQPAVPCSGWCGGFLKRFRLHALATCMSLDDDLGGLAAPGPSRTWGRAGILQDPAGFP